jgi:hypothetical protein
MTKSLKKFHRVENNYMTLSLIIIDKIIDGLSPLESSKVLEKILRDLATENYRRDHWQTKSFGNFLIVEKITWPCHWQLQTRSPTD